MESQFIGQGGLDGGHTLEKLESGEVFVSWKHHLRMQRPKDVQKHFRSFQGKYESRVLGKRA